MNGFGRSYGGAMSAPPIFAAIFVPPPDTRGFRQPYLRHSYSRNSRRGRTTMAKTPTVPPGSNTGKNAGIFQEQGPRGGMRDNFTTVPENRRMPPTSGPGATWKRVDPTPHGHKPK